MGSNIKEDIRYDKTHQSHVTQDALQRKQKRQQRNRRGNTLFKKACELSMLTDADVFLGIRFQDGRIKTFCADKSSFWLSHISHLVLPRMQFGFRANRD
jgi:SRF-type transcription factor (DNA-binding and dimerisation domain)